MKTRYMKYENKIYEIWKQDIQNMKIRYIKYENKIYKIWKQDI